MSLGPIPSGVCVSKLERCGPLGTKGSPRGSGWRRTAPARSRMRSRRAPRVGPRFRAKPWSSPWLLPGAARRLRLCRTARSGPLVRLARKTTNHRRAAPIPKILSGPRRRPIPPETDGTFRLDEIQPRTIRARVSSINVRSFPIKCVFHGLSVAPRLKLCFCSRPSVGHRVIRRPATHPRFRNPSRAFRAIDQTPHRRPVLNPSPRSTQHHRSTSRRPDCRRRPPRRCRMVPPRESNRARATPNTPPARPAARSS